MSNLSPVVRLALERVKNEISQMRRGKSDERSKPHKLIMLLAVLDLAESGELADNRIYFDDRLTKRFENYFQLVSGGDDWCQPAPPFFHLRSSTFWRHQPKSGRERDYALLSTSGGGTRRIYDNIDYAYLTPEAFMVFSDAGAREELRFFISSLVNPGNTLKADVTHAVNQAVTWKGVPVTERLGMVFHEGFSLSRQSVDIVLAGVHEYADEIDITSAKERMDLLRNVTHLGTNYIKSMPRYAMGAGLLNAEYRLTDFGLATRKHDPLLQKLATQWLMHYFLSAPSGPGPTYWHELVSTRFRVGDEFTKEDLRSLVRDYVRESENRELADRSIDSSITVFLGTYTKSDGLQNLGLLEDLGDDRYSVLEPEPPSPWIFGLALLHYWQSNFGDRLTINLDELYADASLAGIFQMSAGRINRHLEDLAGYGYVEVYRVAPPYQIVLLRRDAGQLWDKLYAFDDSDPF